jgi:hypothetical protein
MAFDFESDDAWEALRRENAAAKRLIVDGVRRAEWLAEPERARHARDGTAWVADVLATSGQRQIAFEVQWSRQDDGETRRRHRRYAASDVRALWLFRQRDFPIEKEVPAFRLAFDEASSTCSAQLPSPEHGLWVGAKGKDDSRNWRQTIELSRFVEGALTGRLRFAPVLGLTAPFEVFTETTSCWKCGGDTRLVLGLTCAASRVLPGYADVELDLHSFGDHLQNAAKVIARMMPAALLRSHSIGERRPLHTRTEDGCHLSNGRVHCDILQGRFFENEKGFDLEKTLEVEARSEPQCGPPMEDAASDIYRRWFDDRA